MDRKHIFNAVRRLRGTSFTQDEVRLLDEAIDRAIGYSADGSPRPAPTVASEQHGWALGADGESLIKRWEGCHRRRADGLVAAYPDPGSDDGHPWTIGWGTTGPHIGKDTVWTMAQCDEAFRENIKATVDEVAEAIGSTPTTQNQFDALVSFHYNTGAIARAKLTALHRKRDYQRAKLEFSKWVYNDGAPLGGLKRRRRDEAALYGK